MESRQAEQLARRLVTGEVSVEEFVRQATRKPTAHLKTANVDLDRRNRCGFPEVVFGEGKSLDSLIEIFTALLAHDTGVFATRIAQERADELLERFPEGCYNPLARTFRIPCAADAPPPTTGIVSIVTAGTSDQPVAEEARETAQWIGCEVRLIQDVGVAGPHRLPEHLDQIEDAHAVVVVAGMEGALPSVVGGYVAVPVIAVPTSVGYGASFNGVAALLGMLNSCASNVTVVNIDAGFRGGYVAGLIARNTANRPSP